MSRGSVLKAPDESCLRQDQVLLSVQRVEIGGAGPRQITIIKGFINLIHEILKPVLKLSYNRTLEAAAKEACRMSWACFGRLYKRKQCHNSKYHTASPGSS
jgi:hypothetical protein